MPGTSLGSVPSERTVPIRTAKALAFILVGRASPTLDRLAVSDELEGNESGEMKFEEINHLSNDGNPATTGSIAESLDVSPPSVSEVVTRLEQRFSCEPVVRKHNPDSLAQSNS